MNLFLNYQEEFKVFFKELKKKKKILLPLDLKNLTVELPPRAVESDFSCNAAMILAKENKKNPLELANFFQKELLLNFNEFEKIDIAKPGFLNITFKSTFWNKYLLFIIKSGKKFGSHHTKVKKYNVEFVSANPTGPLHVGHCRGAIIGDTISNLLKFNGNKVNKEYYVNDSGNQIKKFVSSVYHRILEIIENKTFPIDMELYPGEYIIEIAKIIINKKIVNNYKDYKKIYKKLEAESIKLSIKLIKDHLNKLGVIHDSFFYESDLIKKKLVLKTVKKLEKSKYVYSGILKPPKGELKKSWKPRKQLLFNSTKFGDDVDRPLQKEDESWTYFASDIAYHANKIDRKFDTLINILGADHAGYIKRITSAVKAISKNKTDFICKVSQLVKLYKDGQPFKMSKRKGDYITIEDLLKEVGKDQIRFMMLNRSHDVELDFDFKKVTEKTKENPVFYVQYAYARINSIFRVLNLKIEKKINLKKEKFILNKHEIEILKKISEWPKCIEIATKKLEPHRIPFYLYELSTLFHSYWNLGKSNKEFRFSHEGDIVNNCRLVLLQALGLVIKNGMSILGVSTPKSM